MMKPIISTKFAMPFVAAATMLFAGCFDTGKKLHDYMSERGNLQIELDSVLDATKRHNESQEAVVRQSTVDSMAYRDLFNTTQFAKDSSAVAEFNKIAAKASLENDISSSFDLRKTDSNCKQKFYDRAISEGLSISEAEELKSTKMITHGSFSDADIASQYQSFSDMYFYGKFFAEKGLLDDTAFANNFNKVTNFLRK